jgi:hypothetical protein
MYLVLLLIGVLVSAAGFITIGFGIPINAFSLGNTLIVAGTTAVAGGFVVIGLAVVVRHLRRIADVLAARPQAGRVQRPAEIAEAMAPPAARAVPSPVPTRPSMPRPPEVSIPRPESRAEPRAPEPRPTVEPRFPASGVAPGPLDWMRPKAKPPAGPMEPPVVEIRDEAPLSPRPPQRPLFSPPPLSPAASAEPSPEPRAWSPGRGGDVAEAKLAAVAAARSEQISGAEQIARAAPDVRPEEPESAKEQGGKETGLFDVVWPDVRASAAAIPAETGKNEAKLEAAPRRDDPAVADKPADKPAEDSRKEPSASERPTSILKSGVIDGMGYTLYADGSIQAEMPQGTVTFASVDALRAHLEQSS